MRLIAPLAALLLITSAAVAQPAPDGGQPPSAEPPMQQQQMQPPPAQPQRMRMRDRFEAANTTHDGRLTADQAQAAGWRGIVRNFSQIDTDHKGYVTIQDIRAWGRARRQARAAQQQPQQPPAPPQ